MKKIARICICLLIVVGCIRIQTTAQAKENPVNDAKKSIIEVYQGIVDKDGTFHDIKHGSGVVISSQDNSSYILTSYKFLHITEKDVEKFCKKHKIVIDEYSGATTYTKVVVKGDVLVDAMVKAESAEKNFTILEINNSMNEKIPLAIGDSDDLVIGSRIYALGFDKNAGKEDVANRNTEYTYEDVVIYEGSIEDTTANKNGIFYLQHSAFVNQGNKGGPIVDEDGYIVGINDSSISGNGIYYSIPINEIKTILDNDNLVYESKAKNLSLAALDQKIAECIELINSGAYKPKSTDLLVAAIEEAKALKNQGDENMDAVKGIMNDLEAGKEALVLKMTTNRKMIICFAIIDAVLLIMLIQLFLNQKKLKESLNGTMPAKMKQVKTEEKPAINLDAKPVESLHNIIPAKEIVDKKTVTKAPSIQKTKKLDSNNEVFLANKGEESTVILTSSTRTRRPAATLTLTNRGEVIKINKPSFNVGKKIELVDYAIDGNPAISRIHATISWDGERYYISDRGSANGTFVNGDTVGKNQKYSIKNGDNIMLANEEAVFEVVE